MDEHDISFELTTLASCPGSFEEIQKFECVKRKESRREGGIYMLILVSKYHVIVAKSSRLTRHCAAPGHLTQDGMDCTKPHIYTLFLGC